MAIKKIKKVDLSEQVYNQIINQIKIGNYKAGGKIPSEKKLSELFGVSRVSIRAALQKLKAVGILTTIQGDGSYISNFNLTNLLNNLMSLLMISQKNINHILEFREIIEVQSARLAALRKNDKNLEDMEKILEKMEKDKDNLIEFAKDDLKFHFEIAKATQNPVILQINEILMNILSIHMQKIVGIRGSEAGLFYHPKIYEAIRLGDFQVSSKLMGIHIQLAMKEMNEENIFKNGG